MKFSYRMLIFCCFMCLLIVCSSFAKTCDAKELPLMSDEDFEFNDRYREFVEKFPDIAQEAAITDYHVPEYIRKANGQLYLERYTLDVGAKGKHATIQRIDRFDTIPRVVDSVHITHYPATDDKIWRAAILGTLYAIGVEPDVMKKIFYSIKTDVRYTTRTYSPSHGGYICTLVDRDTPNSRSFYVLIFAEDR